MIKFLNIFLSRYASLRKLAAPRVAQGELIKKIKNFLSIYVRLGNCIKKMPIFLLIRMRPGRFYKKFLKIFMVLACGRGDFIKTSNSFLCDFENQ